jgi:PTS system mannose-specific IIA component
MIGIVIVSHGKLGGALIKSAEMILARKEKIFSVSVSSVSTEIEEMRGSLLKTIDEANTGDGVIVLTDLFGGTPSNLAISALGIRDIEIIAGVNLPIVLKLLTLREQTPTLSLSDVCSQAAEAGKKQISIASRLVNPPK